MLNAFFVILFAVSALFFRRAVRERNRRWIAD